MNRSRQQVLNAYIDFYETLTPRSLPLLRKLVDSEFQFSDPFNTACNVDEAIRVFEKMFEDVTNPKFKVESIGWTRDETNAFLKWHFSGTPKGSKDIVEINGLSEIGFTYQNSIGYHIDYWDSGSQLLAKIPVLSWIWRQVKKRLSATE